MVDLNSALTWYGTSIRDMTFYGIGGVIAVALTYILILSITKQMKYANMMGLPMTTLLAILGMNINPIQWFVFAILFVIGIVDTGLLGQQLETSSWNWPVIGKKRERRAVDRAITQLHKRENILQKINQTPGWGRHQKTTGKSGKKTSAEWEEIKELLDESMFKGMKK